ncbi:hypothetical protein FQA39_LY05369 [Lamprigera yunnana]|nr:hypothetical protein FQA39_LY05369 [Lamprigera yunnana]
MSILRSNSDEQAAPKQIFDREPEKPEAPKSKAAAADLGKQYNVPEPDYEENVSEESKNNDAGGDQYEDDNDDNVTRRINSELADGKS